MLGYIASWVTLSNEMHTAILEVSQQKKNARAQIFKHNTAIALNKHRFEQYQRPMISRMLATAQVQCLAPWIGLQASPECPGLVPL